MKQAQKPYHLPLSGQIIGEVCRILRVPYPEHLRKHMQRYFRGEQIHDDYREEILYLLVDTLLKDEILPYPPVFELAFVCHWGLRKLLVRGILEYAARWDSTCVKLRHWVVPRSRREELLTSCLRLAVIDLALRFASFRHLSKLPLPAQATPLWAKRDGNVAYLKHLKERCDDKPSNDKLAEDVGVRNDKTRDAWFRRGKWPSKEHMQGLARAFAERMPGTNQHNLLAEMNRHYTLAAFCEKLVSQIGWDRVMELVGAMGHQTTRLQRFFDQEPKPVEEDYSHYLLHFIGGAGRSSRSQWLKHLWDTESDLEWKRDFLCVERDWGSRLVQVNFRWTGESILARQDRSAYSHLFQVDHDRISASFDYVSASYFDRMIDGEIALWGGAGPEAYSWGEKTEGQFRRAIRSNPDSARAHLNLGTYLGINAVLPPQIEEGFRECIRAAELQPEWDLPRIEAAIILLRVGNHYDALALLERTAAELSRPSPRLAYTIGFAKMMGNDLEGALSMFERAIELKPDYALAFDNAAYCSFRLEDTIKGRRYAKAARQLGISTTYDLYDVGKERHKREIFPYKTLCETVPCREENCKEREGSKRN